MYGGSIVFDGHMDTPLSMVDDGVDLGARREAGHVGGNWLRMLEAAATPLAP